MEIKCVGRNMTAAEIEMAAALVSRVRMLKLAMAEIPKCEPDMLRLELRYLPTKPSTVCEKVIVIAYCGTDVPDMLGVLADDTAIRLAEFGVDARDIV